MPQNTHHLLSDFEVANSQRIGFGWLRLNRIDGWIPWIVGYGLWYVIYHQNRMWFDFQLSLVGLLAAIISFTLDHYSTWAIMRLKPRFHKRHLWFPVEEFSPLLPTHPSLQDQLNWRVLGLAFALWVIGFLAPPVNFAASTSHLLAAYHNWRERGELLRMLSEG